MSPASRFQTSHVMKPKNPLLKNMIAVFNHLFYFIFFHSRTFYFAIKIAMESFPPIPELKFAFSPIGEFCTLTFIKLQAHFALLTPNHMKVANWEKFSSPQTILLIALRE